MEARYGVFLRGVVWVFLGLGVAGCGSEEPAGPTYADDVAPLLEKHCVTCHQEGGIAKFSLTDYAGAHAHAGAIADATAKRQMPPMPVNNDGSCNTYSNARWLSDAEIATFKAWAASGARPGRAVAPKGPPERPPTLDNPDVTIDTGVEYTPDESHGHDDYRCFVIPAPTTERKFLTQFEVVPGDDRVVHHLIVYQPANDDAVASAHALDDAEPGPGYTCFGSPRVDASPFALWAPGTGRVDQPSGTGVPLAAGRELVIQVHYNLENGVYPDRTSVKLRFATEPVITGQYWDVVNADFVAPPGKSLIESSSTQHFDEPISFKVHGALPHMHTLGKTLRAEARTASATSCLVDVDRWDFHWQNAWWYQTPLALTDVSSLSITCGFDTRSRKESVRWGDGTSDEMCISYFYVTTSDAPDPVVSCDNSENPLFGSCFSKLLDGCYAPDLGGTCSASEGKLSWSDGSKVQTGSDAGIYGPGDEEPCIGVSVGEDGVRLTRDDAVLSYTGNKDGFVFGCPDGSSFSATRFQLHEFAVCSGLSCPDSQ